VRDFDVFGYCWKVVDGRRLGEAFTIATFAEDSRVSGLIRVTLAAYTCTPRRVVGNILVQSHISVKNRVYATVS
jgi:hypothetical protein